MVQNKKRIISLILTLTLMISCLVIGAITASAAEEVTISFASTAQRESQTTSKQVWKNGDVTFTNDKSKSTSNIIDSSNPVRLYASSSITLSVDGGTITKIVFNCNSTTYASALKTSVGNEATVSSKVVTVTLSTPASSYTVAKLSAQVRVDSLIVYYEKDSTCAHANTSTATVAATCTTPGSTTVTCDDCGGIVSSEQSVALGHNFLKSLDGKCSREGCNETAPIATFVYADGTSISEYVIRDNYLIKTPAIEALSGSLADKYTLEGWAVMTESATTVCPTLYQPEKDITVDKDTTFYAVYSYTETVDGGDPVFKKVTSLTDWSGTYLIVYETGGLAFNGGLEKLDVASNTISVTITNSEIKYEDSTAAAVFTIAPIDGGYTIQSASGYYIGRDATSNGLNASETVKYINSISNGTIKGKGGYSLQFNKASDQTRFRYFGSTQQAVALYKLDGGIVETTYYVTTLVCDHENKTTTTVDATCTVDGSVTVTCDDCNATLSTETLTAPGHSATCGHNFKVGETFYETLEEALKAGTEVTLVQTVDLGAEALVVGSDAVLNLNGNTVYAAGANITGKICGDGSLVVTAGALAYEEDGQGIVPVRVAIDEEKGTETYIFREAKTLTAEAPEGYDYFFRPTLSGYGVTNNDIFCGEVNNGLTLKLKVTRTPVVEGEGKAQSAYVTISDETIREVYAKTSTGFVVTLTGENDAYNYSVEFVIVSCGVEVYTAPIAYVPKTNEEENQ